MSLPLQGAATAAVTPADLCQPVPRYLEKVYWWAYVHPRAVHLFERDWLVDSILFGNYARLRDAAVEALGAPLDGRTLQVACVYGNLTPRIAERLAPEGRLDIVDILPIQIENLRKKMPPDERVTLRLADASALPMADASIDRVLMFFLLHEQPEAVRRASLAEAMRVLKPGGHLVIVDYHRPVAWHPLRPLMRLIFKRLEPYAIDLWRHEVADFMPADTRPAAVDKRTWFGGLYQRLVFTR
jgi:ubiquinone/menaquinone biosynthesis C-methylase UbiE